MRNYPWFCIIPSVKNSNKSRNEIGAIFTSKKYLKKNKINPRFKCIYLEFLLCSQLLSDCFCPNITVI